jgi:hypothetical protein
MDGTRELLEAIRDNGLAAGRFRGVLHIAIGRKVTRPDGTVVSAGVTWRELARLLKQLRFDKDLVRELGADPEALAPRDRQRFWYSAIALARVDAPGLRLWAAEANAPFHTPEDLQTLAEATAGWPLLVERALENSGRASSERCLTELSDYLSSPAGARAFLAACGLRSNDQPDVASVLADAFAAVAEWTSGSGADLVELAETIGEDGGLAARAAAAGFAGMTDVVTTLQLCGMLVSDPENAQVSAEPVLARVVTAAVATAGGR